MEHPPKSNIDTKQKCYSCKELYIFSKLSFWVSIVLVFEMYIEGNCDQLKVDMMVFEGSPKWFYNFGKLDQLGPDLSEETCGIQWVVPDSSTIPWQNGCFFLKLVLGQLQSPTFLKWISSSCFLCDHMVQKRVWATKFQETWNLHWRPKLRYPFKVDIVLWTSPPRQAFVCFKWKTAKFKQPH